jgi:phosphate transport system substrate-binding protein
MAAMAGTIVRGMVAIAAAALTASTAAGGAGAAAAPEAPPALVGEGTPAAAPVLAVWQALYGAARGVVVSYSPAGSDAGVAAVGAGSADFAVTDAPLTSAEAATCGACLQLPWLVTAAVPVVDVPGVADTALRLSPPVLAHIFLGKVRTWNAPEIANLNRGVDLPSIPITVVHRSDASGTTFALTAYLAKVSPAWRHRAGAGAEVTWPVGVGAEGDAGVAAALASTPGSIGYVSDAYALADRLPKVRVRNASGRYTLPSIASLVQAALLAQVGTTGGPGSIVDPPRSAAYPDAWPVAAFDYVVVPRTTPRAHDLENFVSWALTDGQPPLRRLVFAPLPLALVAAVEKALARLTP